MIQIEYAVLLFLIGVTTGISIMYKVWQWKENKKFEAFRHGATDI